MDILQHPAIAAPTHANIMDLIEQQRTEVLAAGLQEVRPIAPFYEEHMLEDILAAKDWWPVEIDPKFGWPVSFGGAIATYRSPDNTKTLMEQLAYSANRTVVWLKTEGRDTVRPNENKSERMRRLNRERVARHRENAKQGEADGQAPAVPKQRSAAAISWDHVVEVRAQRRAAVQVLVDEVRALYAEMMAKAAERDMVRSEWDAKVAEAEAAHKASGT